MINTFRNNGKQIKKNKLFIQKIYKQHHPPFHPSCLYSPCHLHLQHPEFPAGLPSDRGILFRTPDQIRQYIPYRGVRYVFGYVISRMG